MTGPFKCSGLMLAIVAVLLAPTVSAAGEVVLVSPNLTTSLRGEFVRRERDDYVIIFRGRELFVPAAGMICMGPDCEGAAPVAPPLVYADHRGIRPERLN